MPSRSVLPARCHGTIGLEEPIGHRATLADAPDAYRLPQEDPTEALGTVIEYRVSERDQEGGKAVQLLGRSAERTEKVETGWIRPLPR